MAKNIYVLIRKELYDYDLGKTELSFK